VKLLICENDVKWIVWADRLVI